MSVKIKPITDHESYEVNNHTVFKDSNGNWRSKNDLSHKERQAFIQYENIVIKNPKFKKHTKALYKG
ncbi:hypothetical protein OIU80_05520 [Flavobacterium sp. LS1R47]|uniref:Uncharacterized protein n=1 Tax=Flavobacterium frigoritolerans TaxID=2987686 RepID=A0A9X3C0K0_9FLAO|nr:MULTISPECIES: hypothetical protein [Flavobacterium]MBF7093223.1 hypothetical protein [Flavobacterium sp. ALJ2]MCV9931735.1 hypothetical protein [Flavobacterium frigoritolerans]